MKYDVFICHASEDKNDFVRPLADLLKQQNLEVWYDEFSLSIGDSLSQKIDEGLKKTRFGIVVLSPSFFNKPWAKRELSGLNAREMIEKENLILPIWHRVGVQEVMEFSPPLADKKAASSADGINVVLREILKKVKPDISPLVVARDYLIDLKLSPPSISDEWWLDIVEYKEFLKYPDINASKRWIFPLPFSSEEKGYERGLNIASTALQIDWSFEGEELNISPTTHPAIVHEYLKRWPGLLEAARANPEITALYIPQITIPGFDAGFEKVFDELLDPKNKRANQIFSYGRHDTIDGNEPLCGDVIAFRHPNFGNYTPSELARWYFYAHNTNYIRSTWGQFEGLVWLLSKDSIWLPENIRTMLIEGTKERDLWANELLGSDENPFVTELISKHRNTFEFTKDVYEGIKKLVDEALENLKVNQPSAQIIERLIEHDFIKSYYDYQEYIELRRSSKNKPV